MEKNLATISFYDFFRKVKGEVFKIIYLNLCMEALLIHPENKEQLRAVKAFLKAMKVPFQQQGVNLPTHVQESIEKGLDQLDKGETISFDVFKSKHFIK
ncbi:hypothetical protein RYH73_19195 [Olivibacter sp. CPCC 100613]|uniref:DUF2683 family protein n=1 Tax=Olivibacter sp. CPCC 100613 TaxID=3079931 RepID=UPI002FFB60D7